METSIDEKVVTSLLRQLETFRPTSWHGVSAKRIRDTGVYEESGLLLDADDLELGQYYSALSVLARDMVQYLGQHSRDDASMFQAVAAEVAREEQGLYHAGGFPVYQGQVTQTLPVGMAEAAATGKLDLSPLGDPGIVHEWTSKAGARLFGGFMGMFAKDLQFKEPICKPGGLRDQLTKGSMGQSEVIGAAVQSLLLVFWPAAFWVPVATITGSLLIKRSLNRLCQ